MFGRAGQRTARAYCSRFTLSAARLMNIPPSLNEKKEVRCYLLFIGRAAGRSARSKGVMKYFYSIVKLFPMLAAKKKQNKTKKPFPLCPA